MEKHEVVENAKYRTLSSYKRFLRKNGKSLIYGERKNGEPRMESVSIHSGKNTVISARSCLVESLRKT